MIEVLQETCVLQNHLLEAYWGKNLMEDEGPIHKFLELPDFMITYSVDHTDFSVKFRYNYNYCSLI